MARPKKQKVEYFPHFVMSGRTIFILENTYGNDGYAFWFKLLELLGDTEGHYYECENAANWKFLLAKTHVDEVTAEKIINTLIELGKIDEDLWKEKKIIWVQNFVDNLSELYRKRSTKLPQKPFSVEKTPINNSFRGENSINGDINSAKTPQRKEKESKEKESKEKNNNYSSQNLYSLYEELGFGTINQVTITDIDILVKEYSYAWVEDAFKLCNEKGVRNLSYLKGILKNWKTKGKKEEENGTDRADIEQKLYDEGIGIRVEDL